MLTAYSVPNPPFFFKELTLKGRVKPAPMGGFNPHLGGFPAHYIHFFFHQKVDFSQFHSVNHEFNGLRALSSGFPIIFNR